MRKSTLFEFQVPAAARSAFKKVSQYKLIETEKALVPAMKDALHDWMVDVVADTIRDTSLKKRSGKLFSSLRKGIRVAGGNIGNIRGKYIAIEYAKIHEYGGTIRPTNAQVLTLPLPAALRPDGSPKLARASSWKRYGTFSYQSKKTGRGYLAYKNAAGELVLLYVFVDSVKMLPKLGLRRQHNAQLGQLISSWGNILVRGMLSTNLYSLVLNPTKKIRWLERDVKSVRRHFRPVKS